MNDKDPGPVDTPIDRIREALAEIPGSSVIADALANATVTGIAAIPAGPLGIAGSLAGAFTTWHGGRRTAVILDRLQRVLWLMVEPVFRVTVFFRRSAAEQALQTFAAAAELGGGLTFA